MGWGGYGGREKVGGHAVELWAARCEGMVDRRERGIGDEKKRSARMWSILVCLLSG
jgi:hypothetical protein